VIAAGHRPATASDVPIAVEVFLESLDELYGRVGLPRPPLTPATVLPTYEHIFASGLFRVAEADGEIASIACGIVRDDVWFLSGFWTRPRFQGRGLGGQLLAAIDRDAIAAGATTLTTWSSVDLGAMAMYLRAGMLPECLVVTLAGAPRGLVAPPDDVELVPLTVASVGAIDRVVRGATRDVDQRFWLEGAGGHEGWEVRRAGRVVGCFQLDGRAIGPAAWLGPADANRVLRAAIATAMDRAGEVRFSVPGANRDALTLAFGCGLRLVGYGHYLTSAPVRGLDRYLPSGPLLF